MSADQEIIVYVAGIAASHGLMQFFLEHSGTAYILSDEHYLGMNMSADLSHMEGIDPLDVRHTDDRIALIRKLKRTPDYEGIIPMTPSSLEDMTELGMKRIAAGLITENMPNVPDGTHLDLYK